MRYNINYLIDYALTCFMLIKKGIFIKVGMMDEKYFVYYDDTDFVYRAKQKNCSTFIWGKRYLEEIRQLIVKL